MRNAIAPKRVVRMQSKSVFPAERLDLTGASGSECIVFCKRVAPNVFNIKDGFAIIAGVEDCFNDGVCMIANFTKVVFVLEQGTEQGVPPSRIPEIY